MSKGLITRSAFVRSISEEQIQNRQVEFVISTEAVDTYGTVFKADGWNLERYNDNPVVMYAHKTHSDDPDMVIGTSEVRIENGQLIGIVTFEEEDTNPTAEKILRKIQKGILRMASIDAIVHQWRWGDFDSGENPEVLYFTEQSLLEWSIVPVGSNPDALKRGIENLEDLKQRFPKEKSEIKQYPSLAVREAKLKLNLKMFS